MAEYLNTPEDYMRMVLALARQGEGQVSPNPMVGCVVVKDGRVIAQGYHEKYGGFHAERNALLQCRENTEGAELYVNLEPCCHQGKTPPCTDIILEKKIRKVYVGCLDSNPKVAGKGVRILREHGVEVEVGILGEECRTLNEVFFHYMEENLPFVAMKYAMTLDGKIACESGDSRWVSGAESRDYVQCLRNRYRGIMAGIGTVQMDDPLLSCRMEGGRNPVRILCDARLRIPLDSQIVRTAGEIETIVAWNAQAAGAFRASRSIGDENCSQNMVAGEHAKTVQETVDYLTGRGVTLLEIPLKGEEPSPERLSPEQQNAGQFSLGLQNAGTLSPELDLQQLLRQLGGRGIDSILLEGGGTLNASMLQENLVQRVYAFVAPKLVAGAKAKSPVEGTGILRMKDAVELEDVEISHLGKDICIMGRIRKERPCLREL